MTNRAGRRQLEKMRKRTAKQVRKNSDATVTLLGGPMADWVVPPDAPVLDARWGANSGYPGWKYAMPAYDETYGTTTSRWGNDGD